jgi:hypothetical protein
MVMSTKMIMDWAWKVDSVDAQSVITLDQKIERIQMKIQSAQGVMLEYDSAAGKEPEGMAKMVAPMLEAMLKNPFRIIFTSRGDVKDVKFPPGMLESMNKSTGGQMGNIFSADWIKQIGLISLFPEGPITPGQSWMHETTMKNPLLGNQAIKTTFRYAGTETRDARPLEKIDLTMSWKPEGKKQEGEKKDAEKKAETTRLTISEGKGVLLFDNSAGRVVESTMEMRMKIDMAVMGQKVTQDLNMKMHMSPLPAESVPAPSAKEK